MIIFINPFVCTVVCNCCGCFFRLALLWYHTIVRPFFNLDGVIVASGVEEATKILEEEVEFQNSALFLFFKGRVERIKVKGPV